MLPEPTRSSEEPYALSGGYPRGLVWLLFSFKGRINRGVWWLSSLTVGVCFWCLQFLVAGAASLLPRAVGWAVLVVFLVITYVAGLWIGFALGSKRVHDHGSEFLPWGIGWGVLTIGLAFLRVAPASDFAAFVGFLALVGFVAWLYVFGFKAGDPDGNAYGDPNPASGAVKFSV